eukprot:1148407-Pelagomonas_calceolata.AAC.4
MLATKILNGSGWCVQASKQASIGLRKGKDCTPKPAIKSSLAEASKHLHDQQIHLRAKEKEQQRSQVGAGPRIPLSCHTKQFRAFLRIPGSSKGIQSYVRAALRAFRNCCGFVMQKFMTMRMSGGRDHLCVISGVLEASGSGA